MMTIAEFCARHGACHDGRAWALANCRDMGHAWETLRPDWLLWVATQPGVLDDRTLRLFAVWSARQVQHLMDDKRSLAALEVAERYANGQATDNELSSARAAARYAALAATRPGVLAAAPDAAPAAASAAALAATLASAQAAASAAASAAARAVAWHAAWAAQDAAQAAARAAARAAQAAWLLSNAKPRFDGGAR